MTRTKITLIAGVVISAVIGVVTYSYYRNQDTDLSYTSDESPVEEEYSDDDQTHLYRVISDTVFIHYNKTCSGASIKEYKLAFTEYAHQLTTLQRTDVDNNRDLSFSKLEITDVMNWMPWDTTAMACYPSRKDTTAFGYVDAKALVTELEFTTFYEPVFGKIYQSLYRSIPLEFKRAIITFLRDNDYVDHYRLTPNMDRSGYVLAFGNFTRAQNPARYECIAVVFDEKDQQASRLVIFGRVAGSRETYIAYNEYFGFPATVEAFDAQHMIKKNGADLQAAGTDGIFVRFDLETTKALLFDEELKRFEWYVQDVTSMREEE